MSSSPDPRPEFQSHLNRIVSLQGKGLTEQAIVEAGHLISAYNDLPGAHCMRGGLLITIGRYQEAIPDLNQAIKLDRAYQQAYRYRGIAWRNLGKHDKALRDLKVAIALSKHGDSVAYTGLGDMHFSKEEYPAAIEAYAKAIDIDQNPEAVLGEIECLIILQRFAEAVKASDSCVTSSESAVAYSLRGWSNMLLGQHHEAHSDFEAAAAMSADGGGSYAHYG